jgi:hypothetical protein
LFLSHLFLSLLSPCFLFAFLPAFPSAFMHACLPFCLPSFLLACLLSLRTAFVPSLLTPCPPPPLDIRCCVSLRDRRSKRLALNRVWRQWTRLTYHANWLHREGDRAESTREPSEAVSGIAGK